MRMMTVVFCLVLLNWD